MINDNDNNDNITIYRAPFPNGSMAALIEI